MTLLYDCSSSLTVRYEQSLPSSVERRFRDQAREFKKWLADPDGYTPHQAPRQLVTLSKHTNVGDQNQVLGAVGKRESHLKSRGQSVLPTVNLSFGELDLNIKTVLELNKLLDEVQHGMIDHVEVVAAGGGQDAESASALFPVAASITTALIGHDLPESFDTMSAAPDIVAATPASIPSERATRLSERTHVVVATGVSHNVTDSTIAGDIAKRAEKNLPRVSMPDENTIGVVLGGDDDKQGPVRRFTEQDAQALARHHLSLELKDRAKVSFLVTNGPRTGLYDSDGNKRNPDPHRIGELDSVTRSYVDELRTNPNVTVELHDFQFSQLPSAYKPIIGAFKAVASAGRLHVDGASFSMLTETSDHLNNVTGDRLSMMSDVQISEMQSRFKDGSIDKMNLDGSFEQRIVPWPGKQPSVSDRVADALEAVVSQKLQLSHA